jgi:hypothetical protein
MFSKYGKYNLSPHENIFYSCIHKHSLFVYHYLFSVYKRQGITWQHDHTRAAGKKVYIIMGLLIDY